MCYYLNVHFQGQKVNNGVVVHSTPSPFRHTETQVWPTDEFLTNFAVLLWVRVGQPRARRTAAGYSMAQNCEILFRSTIILQKHNNTYTVVSVQEPNYAVY